MCIRDSPMILLLFLVPAIVSLIGGAAIAGGAGAFGAFDEFTMEDGSFEISDTFNIGGLIGAAALVTIVVSVISILVSGIAIAMTADALDGMSVDLSRGFDRIKDKWLLLIVASIVLAILQFIGVLACCIGYVVVVIVTVFVIQGIVLDDLGLTESIGNSFNLAKKVWPDILILYIIALIATIVLALIPFIGSFIGQLVSGFFTIAFTIYYLGITRVLPAEPAQWEGSS